MVAGRIEPCVGHPGTARRRGCVGLAAWYHERFVHLRRTTAPSRWTIRTSGRLPPNRRARRRHARAQRQPGRRAAERCDRSPSRPASAAGRSKATRRSRPSGTSRRTDTVTAVPCRRRGNPSTSNRVSESDAMRVTRYLGEKSVETLARLVLPARRSGRRRFEGGGGPHESQPDLPLRNPDADEGDRQGHPHHRPGRRGRDANGCAAQPSTPSRRRPARQDEGSHRPAPAGARREERPLHQRTSRRRSSSSRRRSSSKPPSTDPTLPPAQGVNESARADSKRCRQTPRPAYPRSKAPKPLSRTSRLARLGTGRP